MLQGCWEVAWTLAVLPAGPISAGMGGFTLCKALGEAGWVS